MSKKERDRLDVMARVKRKELTVVEASAMLGLSEREARRVWKRFGAEGAAGLVHGLRGRASNRRFPEEFRARVIKMRQGNALLEEMFLDDLNRRYAVKARRETDLHRRLDQKNPHIFFSTPKPSKNPVNPHFPPHHQRQSAL